MVVMAVEMMMMMIPMKSNVMTMRMAMILPLQEGISPADFSLPESFSLSVVSASWRRRNISSMALPVLGFLGDEIREGGAPEVGQGPHTPPRRGQEGTRAALWCVPLVAHLYLPFWLPPASDKIGTSAYFP